LEESQDFKIPHLRNVYQKLNVTRTPGAQSVGGFGIVHDGVDPDLFTFLSRDVFQRFSTNTVFKRDLDAFVQCFDTGMAPAVGYARTLHAGNVNSASVSNDWDLLEAQADLRTNIDLIVKGTIDGRQRGLFYQSSSRTYRPDTASLPAMTRAELAGKVLASDTLTIMGVPPGTGTRMGIDRNLDGVLDGDVPAPALRIAGGTGSAVILWSTNATGFVLERTESLPSLNWAPDQSLRGVSGSEFAITNSLSMSNLFFRLREL
jgi:hypothetical protein